MAETVGRVDFIAGLDGDKAVRDARTVGEKIGKEGDKAGADFGDRFDHELSPRMRATSERMSKLLSDGLKLDGTILEKNSTDLDRFTKLTRQNFREMSDDTRDAFRRMLPDDLVTRFDSVGYAAESMWKRIDVDNSRLDRFNFQWQDLSHNTKQWTLIIGAVLAGMQDLAVLSSAAGAGLLGVGGALSSAIVGVGGAVAVFSVLAKDLDELPPNLREVATQFRGLGDELVNVRDIIATNAIAEMPLTFSRLSTTVSALNPRFAALGTAVGGVFDDMSVGLRQGTAGFKELDRFIDETTRDFPALASAAGTWTVALLRGLNKANPLTDQLIGYVDKLGDRFDAFTRSNSFDQWISNSMTTFTAFGNLLDATGRALNDLVTPTSILRTQQFLDNLTAFMPNLSRLLDVLGRVDVFGLAAQLLNEFGAALEPLALPAAELADALNKVGEVAIGVLAEGLSAVAIVAAPLVKGLADVVDAIPPEVLERVASGVLVVASAFLLLKGAQGVAGAFVALDIFTASATKAEAGAGKLAATLKSGLGKAGAVGLAIVGVTALADGFVNAMEAMYGVEDAARNVVAGSKSLATALETVYVGGGKLEQNLGDVLDRMGELDNFFVYISALDGVGNEAVQLAKTLQGLSPELANLAQNDLPAATTQFAAWATELGASDKQVLNMLENMPEFKQALIDAAGASGDLLTDQELVAVALGETAIGAKQGSDAFTMLGNAAILSGDGITALDEKIQNFVTNNLEARSAARDYEAAIDDLTQSVIDNGTSLDITGEAGRRNEAAIDALVAKTMTLSEETLNQTGSQAAANDVIRQGRDRLIEQLDAFGITGDAAQAYVDDLGLIVPSVETEIITPGLQAAQEGMEVLAGQYDNTTPVVSTNINTPGLTAAQQGVSILTGQYADVTPYVDTTFQTPGLRAAQDGADTLANKIRKVPTSWNTNFTVTGGIGAVFPKTAVGGMFNGAQIREIAEDGPEAVVPLNRPLSQVDPSVRWLSAIAQGKTPEAAAVSTDSGSRVTFEAGAIVVQGADDPRETAIEVANEIAELIGS